MEEEIIFKIDYTEDMRELVDQINRSNEAMITAFTAMLQQQSSLILKEFGGLKNDVVGLKKEVGEIKDLVSQINSKLL